MGPLGIPCCVCVKVISCTVPFHILLLFAAMADIDITGPITAVQKLLIDLHATTSLPWWATMAVSHARFILSLNFCVYLCVAVFVCLFLCVYVFICVFVFVASLCSLLYCTCGCTRYKNQVAAVGLKVVMIPGLYFQSANSMRYNGHRTLSCICDRVLWPPASTIVYVINGTCCCRKMRATVDLFRLSHRIEASKEVWSVFSAGE